MRLIRYAFVGFAAIAAPPARAQVPALLPVPDTTVQPDRDELRAERRTLYTRLSFLKQRAQRFNASCANVVKGSPAAVQCRQRQGALEAERKRYVADAESFNGRVQAAPRLTASGACPKGRIQLVGAHGETLWCLPPSRMRKGYRLSGRGLVGGTGWSFAAYSYYVPPTVSHDRARAIGAEAKRRFIERLKAAGKYRSDVIEPQHYDFIIGVAASASIGVDLAARVIWDNLARGRATSTLQQDYNKLKGRAFETLDCHSNGAMVCLAALANGDVLAQRVRLLGPQITSAALREWQRLIETGKIKGLEIHYADRDPIPVVSYIGNYILPPAGTPAARLKDMAAIAQEALLGGGLKKRIAAHAPSATVVGSTCAASPRFIYSLECHAARNYGGR